MANRGEYPEFKRILKEGIGSRSQAEFARMVGVDPATLCRILRNKIIPQPRKSTLRRIAEKITNATLSELYVACGYPDDAEFSDTNRTEMTTKTTNIDDLQPEINEILMFVRSFSSFDDFIGTLRLKFSKQKVIFEISEQGETSEFRSDYFRRITAREERNQGKSASRVNFNVYYSVTKNGRVIINNVLFDPERNNTTSDVLLPQKDIDSACETKSIGERIDRQNLNILDIPALRAGFGFYFDEKSVPSGYLEFLKKHITALPHDVAMAIECMTEKKEFLNYFDSCPQLSILGSNGVGLPIELIVETEHPSEKGDVYWCRTSDSGLAVPELPYSCVMVDIGKKTPEQIEEIKKYMYDYAAEIGIREVETVYYPYLAHIEIGKDKIIINK